MTDTNLNVRFLADEHVLTRLHSIETKLEKLMALSQEILDLLKKVDTATTAISDKVDAEVVKIDLVAQRLADLANQVNDDPALKDALNAESDKLDAITAKITSQADTLDAMGKPGQPIPPGV